MEVEEKTVYNTTKWAIEYEGEIYYVRLTEDDVVDHWSVEGDSVDVDKGSVLWWKLVNFCCEDILF